MKKAQIQFGETIMVVVILVFLLVIGIVFYFNATKGSLEKEFSYREDIESVKLAKSVLALPELSCGGFTGGGTTCMDALKASSLATIKDRPGVREYYRDRFGFATIKLNPLDGVPLTLYDSDPRPVDLSKKWNVQAQRIFTTLYDPLTDTMTLGYLNVTRYSAVVSS